MKKTIYWLVALIIASSTGYLAYNRYVSPTRIAFVNYMDFMYDSILDAETNSFIKTEAIPLDDDTFKNASDYDAMFLFAHGNVNLSTEQKAQIEAAVAEGTAVIYRSPITQLQNDALDPDGLKYVLDCLQNGGKKNYERMLNYTRRVFDNKKLFVDPITDPFILPNNYYYHLGEEEVFEDVLTYIQFLKDSGRYNPEGSNICLLAAQFGSSSKNSHINQLVTAFEALGHNVFPTVTRSKKRLEFVEQTDPDMVVFIPHGRFAGEPGVEWLKEQNIPMLCPIVIFGPEDEWLESPQGMEGGMLSQAITMPELDGGSTPMPIAAQTLNDRGLYVFTGIKERIETFTTNANKWLTLKSKANADKKVAIFYYKEAGKNSLVAEGLELGPSILNLLTRLKAEGYSTGELPKTPEALLEIIQEKGPVFGTYAKGSIAEYMKTGDPVLMPSDKFQTMLNRELDPILLDSLREHYGEAPGNFMTLQKNGVNNLVITRVDFGNVILLPVPPPGFGDDEVKLVHGVTTPPPYPYVGSYLWARTEFAADAIIHFGTHGSVEFTPKKQVALSNRDWPDALLAGTPHFYLYVISNIGEAMTAKRRSYAIMNSHLTAPLMESDIYGPIKELDDLLERYWGTEQEGIKEEYRKSIHELVVESDLYQDMEFEFEDGELIGASQMQKLHHYLHQLEMAKITKGLHVLGQPYTEDEVNDTLHLMAIDSLVYDKKKMDVAKGIVTEEACEDAHFMENHYREPAFNILKAILNKEADPLDFLTVEQLDLLDLDDEAEEAMSASEMAYLHALRGYENTLVSITRYREGLVDSPELELHALINSLNGGYTAPQSGGDPAFNPEAVPSGRNHYSISETKTPSEQAYDAAKKLIDKILARRLEESGSYPEKVAFTLWSSEFIRQEGITIAEIFYLLGVEPVRNSRGTVHDIKLIPIEELGRPRIDVVVQTSGQFRDLAASRIYLINRAVKMAAEADDGETEFTNFVSKGMHDSEALMKEKGVAPAEARKLSTIRVFGGLNGAYGASIMGMVEDGDSWDSEDQIAQRYLYSMGAMYGKDVWGDYKPGAFEGALQNASMVIHPRSSNTWGALSLDHVYEFMGGLSNVIRYVTGKDPEAWFSDVRNPNNPQAQRLEEAIWTEARTTLLNPKYIKGMQEEGPTGAGIFAETFRNTYSWDVMKTTAVDPELWDNLNKVYIDDIHELGIEDYFREKNPYALQEMTAVMLEVVRKGYWNPDAEVIEKIATLHAQLVTDYDAGCSGFVCDNAKLRELIASKVKDSALADSMMESITQARTAEATEAVSGVELTKTDEEKKTKQNQTSKEEVQKSNTKMLIVILGVIFVVFIGLLRKKRAAM